MNRPEYILVDEIGTIVGAVKTALALSVLNYQYGYVKELNETLNTWALTPQDAPKRFPLVWLAQPFVISHEEYGWWGEMQNAKMFILNLADPQSKAAKRMELNFKPIIYPIYRELLKQLHKSLVFDTKGANQIRHQQIDRYYWGNEQKSVLDSPVDCLEISNLYLKVNNNLNCGSFFNGG